MSTRNTYTTRAAFWFAETGWVWVRWTHDEPNHHAAIVRKANELAARCCDFGNADHYETSRYPFPSR